MPLMPKMTAALSTRTPVCGGKRFTPPPLLTLSFPASG